MILPDTSIWVDYLRAERSPPSGHKGVSPAADLEQLIQEKEILTCGPIVSELLAGARGPHRDELAEQLKSQPWIDLKRADWLTVGHAAARLQEKGETTPLVYIQIAVCAISAKAELWTRDHDFERITKAIDNLYIRLFE